MNDITDPNILRKRFHALMVETLRRCVKEIKYNPSNVRMHMDDHDGVDTAIWLVSIPTYSSGFTRLWEEGRLDLSAEALVLQPEYAPLFSVELRQQAYDTLSQYRYKFPPAISRP